MTLHPVPAIPVPLPPLEDVDLVRLDRCNLCGSSRRQPLLSTHNWTSSIVGPKPIRAVVCDVCGLIYLAETLPKEILEHPGKHGGSLTYGLALTTEDCDRYFQRQLRKRSAVIPFLEPHIEDFRGLRTLDILSESGAMVKALQEAGAVAEGLERSAALSTYATEVQDLKIHNDLLEEFEPPQPYDLISGAQLLNHFLDPTAVLEKVHRLLSPDGFLYLEVLNFPHAIRRKSLEKCLHVDHPHMFTATSLSDYLRKTDFEILTLEADCDLDRKHDFGSLNHIHVVCRPSSEVEPFVPSPTASVDTKLECLTSLSQFLSDRATERG